MNTILLTQGKVALVDDLDFDWVSSFKWHARVSKSGVCYAARWEPTEDGRKLVLMHREIWGDVPAGFLVEHQDGNGVNNVRNNLMLGTEKSNARGFCRKRNSASSKYRGVFWSKTAKKWIAQIRVGERGYHLGIFDSEVVAALVRDQQARKWGFHEQSMNFPIL